MAGGWRVQTQLHQRWDDVFTADHITLHPLDVCVDVAKYWGKVYRRVRVVGPPANGRNPYAVHARINDGQVEYTRRS